MVGTGTGISILIMNQNETTTACSLNRTEQIRKELNLGRYFRYSTLEMVGTYIMQPQAVLYGTVPYRTGMSDHIGN